MQTSLFSIIARGKGSLSYKLDNLFGEGVKV